MLKQFVLRCAYRFHQETGLRLSHHVIPLCTDIMALALAALLSPALLRARVRHKLGTTV